MQKYIDMLKTMPQNHLGQDWLDAFIKYNSDKNHIIEYGENWIGVENLRFMEGTPDPKYNYEIKNHYTYFAIDGISFLEEVEESAMKELFEIQSSYFSAGWYMYWNASATRTIQRLHFHCIEWKLDNNNLVIPIAK